MSTSEFRLATKKFVLKALSESGTNKPSDAKVKQAVSKIVRALGPVVVNK